MNNLFYNEEDKRFKIFNYQNLGKIKVLVEDQGKTWFCLNDICNILNLSVEKILSEHKDVFYMTITYMGEENSIPKTPMNFVSEAGLYQVIGKSNNEKEQNFMYWILGNVLPELRKDTFSSSKRDWNKIANNSELFDALIDKYVENRNKLRETKRKNTITY